ncbi:MAG: copper amine oxidase N-terminal domain-containing protein [Candidatus Eremiobacteraeota bacterium]|nr:copper amine oxidase N-terminal domain-containing protein [Candidatus Eremiobacteraeota bacterium]
MRSTALFLLLALLPAAALAARVKVAVNDRPIELPAYANHGRVMVPMRSIFEALGAQVTYEGRKHMIHAATATHWLALQIGSKTATVDGRSQKLDAPARVRAERTFVPIRFVSQSLGAVVGYDNRTNTVAIHQHLAAPIAIATPQNSGLAPTVVDQEPAPNQRLTTTQPTISATIARHGGPAVISTNLFVDGNDVSSQTKFDGSILSYVPRDRLAAGWHNVFVHGADENGLSFDSSWSFSSPDPQYGYNSYPAYSQGFQFYANGPTTFYPGQYMNFVLIAPPGGYATLQLCNGWQYPFSNYSSGNFYQITQAVPWGYSYPYCNATAIYTGWNGQETYVPIPIYIAIYTRPTPAPPIPQPTGTPGYRNTTPVGRRPETTPTPSPVPSPRRTMPTPHPIILRTPPPRARVTPIPRRVSPPIVPRPRPKPQPKATPV